MRAVLCGYYGKGNGGDEALLASLLHLLPPGITPIVLSGNPRETTSRYGVESCDRNSPSQVLSALGQSDYFIWGGGSLMQDVTSIASPFYYGGLMALAQQLGLKTIAWAQGIGPLQRPVTRWLTQQVLHRCAKISVRDRASAALLQSWQMEPILAPDPVWVLDSEPVTDLAPLPTPHVAITLRPHPSLTPQRLENLTLALIAFQKASQTSFILIPFQPSQDLAILEAIAPRLPGPYLIAHHHNPRQLKGLFQRVEMAIGMRLHSLIMAAAEGCRCFALSYDPKVSQLMADVNLPGWELTNLPLDPYHISETWLETYQHPPLNPSTIQTIKAKALEHRQILAEVMKAKDSKL